MDMTHDDQAVRARGRAISEAIGDPAHDSAAVLDYAARLDLMLREAIGAIQTSMEEQVVILNSEKNLDNLKRMRSLLIP